MEACENAHYMARKFSEMRHKTKLIPPHFANPSLKLIKMISLRLKPYVKLHQAINDDL